MNVYMKNLLRDIALLFGVAYSRRNLSITFAVNDSNSIQSGDTAGTLRNLTRYGSLTVVWRR